MEDDDSTNLEHKCEETKEERYCSIGDLLKKQDMQVDLKEKKIELIHKPMSLRIEKKKGEEENDTKRCIESSSIINTNHFFDVVVPNIGETWALFRDWNNNPEHHKPPYSYDLVEIVVTDDQHGVGVAYLGKVTGFASLFTHAAHRGVLQFMIGKEEMGRFSHKVPSFRMNGGEKVGVPAGSFQLDPLDIPSSLLKLDHYSLRGSTNETDRCKIKYSRNRKRGGNSEVIEHLKTEGLKGWHM